jgi:hypothetical protein
LPEVSPFGRFGGHLQFAREAVEWKHNVFLRHPNEDFPMLFLVISEPRPERPSSVNAARQAYWHWIQPLIEAGEVRSVHAKVGRGAVVLFDVPSNEILHAHLNAWADIIPATFQVHALIDPSSARRYLGAQTT